MIYFMLASFWICIGSSFWNHYWNKYCYFFILLEKEHKKTFMWLKFISIISGLFCFLPYMWLKKELFELNRKILEEEYL